MLKINRINLILLMFCFTFIYSCGKSDDEIRKEKREHIKQKVKDFADRNNAEVSIDTIDYDYTIQFQGLTKDNPRILIPDFRIDDFIAKKGRVYLIGTSHSSHFFYELSASPQLMKEIYDNMDHDKRLDLIIEKSKFKKLSIQVSPEYENYSYSENDTYTEDDIDIDTYLTLDNYYRNDYLAVGEIKNYQIIND